MRAFPMIAVAVLLYNLVALGAAVGGHADIQAVLDQNFSVRMFSGESWRITAGDLFVLLCLALLFVETLKAARSSSREILNHALSTLVFCAALVEFLVLKGFSTSTFFFITVMSLFDVVAGYTLSIVAARRDMQVAPPDYED